MPADPQEAPYAHLPDTKGSQRRSVGALKKGAFVRGAPKREPAGAPKRLEVIDAATQARVDMIVAAVGVARELVAGALAALRPPLSADASAALAFNFHTTDPDDIETIVDKYEDIRDGLAGDFTIDVEDSGGGRAYVNDYFFFMGDITLRPGWFASDDPLYRAAVLVHEGSHKWAGTDDNAERYPTRVTHKYENLDKDEALDNAYSYEWFAMDLKRPRLRTIEHLDFVAPSPPELGAAAFACAHVWAVDDTPRVVYRGQDRKLYELTRVESAGWRLACPTDIAGAPTTRADPWAYAWTGGDSRHIIYVDKDKCVQELHAKAGTDWRLSTALPARRPRGVGSPHGLGTFEDAHHVAYIGEDLHLHLLTFERGRGWRWDDLCAAASAPLANGNLVVCEGTTDSRFSVVYGGDDHHVHRVCCDPDGRYTHVDLTAASRAPDLVGRFAALRWLADDAVLVCFRDARGDVHLITKEAGETSARVELRKITGAPAAAGDPCMFRESAGSTLHVAYLDARGAMHLLARDRDRRWSHVEVAAHAGQHAVGPYGLAWPHESSLHLFYGLGGGALRELRRKGGAWEVQVPYLVE